MTLSQHGFDGMLYLHAQGKICTHARAYIHMEIHEYMHAGGTLATQTTAMLARAQPSWNSTGKSGLRPTLVI